MKRKEFITQVEKLGFRVIKVMNYVEVAKYGMPILEVFEDKPYSIDIIKAEFDNLTEADRKQLFTFATEYAATPLEEREEEKRYVIRDKDGIVLNYLIWYSFPSIGWKYTSKEDEENIILDSLEKAQALALLVDGEVEEL